MFLKRCNNQLVVKSGPEIRGGGGGDIWGCALRQRRWVEEGFLGAWWGGGGHLGLCSMAEVVMEERSFGRVAGFRKGVIEGVGVVFCGMWGGCMFWAGEGGAKGFVTEGGWSRGFGKGWVEERGFGRGVG